MNAIDTIREALHIAAGVLIWPVLIGLLGLAGATLMSLGMALREGFERRGGRSRIRDEASQHMRDMAAQKGANLDVSLERVLQAGEVALMKPVKLLTLAVRVGPALGLMGTLIPMAYALQGLASGNLPALASNLVTAFAATVIGLAVSVICYLLAALRDGWAQEDARALAFEADLLLRVGPST